MRYLKKIITYCILLLLSGCLGGMLHYSKFQYYDVVKSDEVNAIENDSSFKVSVTISDAVYSQRWRHKYYVVIPINFYNEGSDTAIVTKSIVSLKMKTDSFFIRNDYTTIDENGKQHYFKLFKLPNVYKIPPKSNMLIPFQFDSYKRYSEKEYQTLFKNDSLVLSVGNKIKFKLWAKQK